jgi:hypothetical protein
MELEDDLGRCHLSAIKPLFMHKGIKSGGKIAY